jgi:actin-like ATPase involved in cell morphogenesis
MPRLLSLSWRRPTLAIDLGTAFVRVGTPSQPLAVEQRVPAVAGRARAMRAGVVHDIDAAAAVLQSAMRQLAVGNVHRARTLVSVPATATPVERQAVRWVMEVAGVGSELVLIDEPLAAAVGLGLDIADDRPRLIVDVGHGISEAAVVASGALRAIRGVRVGCAQLGDPVTGTRTADDVSRMVVDLIGELQLDEAAAIDEVHLVGGGSLLTGVQRGIAEATGLPIRLDAERLHAVVRGDALCALESFGAAARRR